MIHTNQNNLGPLNYNLTINNVWTCQTNVFSDTPDATGREVYGNGQLLNAAATFNQSAFPSETLYIGSRAGSAGFFIGQIGIVRVYNRKLSAAEVLQNFEATRARFGI